MTSVEIKNLNEAGADSAYSAKSALSEVFKNISSSSLMTALSCTISFQLIFIAYLAELFDHRQRIAWTNRFGLKEQLLVKGSLT